MKLTKRQRSLIEALREDFKQATQLWGNSPAEFDTNIHYLADLEKITRDLLEVFKYELRAVRNDELELDDVAPLLAKSFKYLMSDDVKDVVKHEFSKEPRITNVGASVGYERCQFGMFKPKEVKFDYDIKFSNGTELNFHSLTKEKVLDKMRSKFEREMEELALHQSKRQKVSV